MLIFVTKSHFLLLGLACKGCFIVWHGRFADILPSWVNSQSKKEKQPVLYGTGITPFVNLFLSACAAFSPL